MTQYKPIYIYANVPLYGFFHAALYSVFTEAVDGIVLLPEDSVSEIKALVSWIYTGRLSNNVPPEVLWVLGDRHRVPSFQNECMHYMFSKYSSEWLLANTATWIYDHTIAGSKIREFIADHIAFQSPLCPEALEYPSNQTSGYEEDWHDLIRGGGDIGLDVTLRNAGFSVPSRATDALGPCGSENQSRYLCSSSLM